MKQNLTTDLGSYAFNKTAKTVTFTGITPTLKQILLIVNTTRGIIIYNPFDPALLGTLSTNVLTLAYNTASQADADELAIFLDVPAASVVTPPASAIVASGNITILNSNLATGTATASSTIALAALHSVSAVTMQVTGTWTGTLVGQVSNDGTNWVTLALLMNVNTGVFSATIVSAATGIWAAGVGGFKYFRLTASAAMTGTAVATLQAGNGAGLINLITNAATGNGVSGATVQRVAIASDNSNVPANVAQINGVTPLMGAGNTGTGSQRVTIASDQLIIPVSIVRQNRATYRSATAAVLVAAAGTGLFFVIAGSASKTIKLQRIRLGGLTLTAVAYLNINLAKYSTAPSAGTATALTKVPIDSNNAAATANLVQGYTAAPTAGTKVGDIGAIRLLGQATTAAAAGSPETLMELDFSTGIDEQAIILRGTAENIGLYFATAPATAVSMMLAVSWTEE